MDNGGLALAAENQGSGYGWGGWEDWEDLETRYAEVLSDMYSQTLNVSEFNECLPRTVLPPDTRKKLIESLDSWNFEPHKLSGEHVLACTLLLFESLFRLEGMQEEVGISLSAMGEFLCHLRNVYRWENPYHNYAHALDVLQATHKFLSSAGMVPPASILLQPGRPTWKSTRAHDIHGHPVTCLRQHDLFVLYIAAIGHDVGHPGHSNAMIKNAQAPLSIVYDGRSPLEQMHYFLLLKVMRHHGFGPFLERPGIGIHIRRLLWNTIIATDMGNHTDFMTRFESLLTPEDVPIHLRQVLVCQAIIKCADISNPCRPRFIAQYWAGALTKEWASQLSLERRFDLPVTVSPADDPLSVAKSQIWFIGTFAHPLFSLVSRGIPEMEQFRTQCSINLSEWERLAAELKSSPVPPSQKPAEAQLRQLPVDDLSTVFPFTLPCPISSDRSWSPISSPPSSAPSSTSDATDDSPLSTTIPLVSTPGSPSESTTFSVLSSRSEHSATWMSSPPSSNYGRNHVQHTSDGSTSLRAALHTGLRKRAKEAHRSSWTPPSRTAVPNGTPMNRWVMPRIAMVVASTPAVEADGKNCSRS